MKKIHIALISAAAVILMISLVIGALSLYSNQRTLPKGTTLAGWEVGGMDTDEVRAALTERLSSLHSIPLTLTAEGSTELNISLKEAGVTYDAKPFLQAMQDLTEGGLLERVKTRRNFPLHWTLNVHLDISSLQHRLTPAWEKETFGEPVNATRRITEDDRVLYTPETSSRKVDWTALAKSLEAVVPADFTQLEQAPGKGITVAVPLTIMKPVITLKSLQDEGIERKIAEFSTSLGSSGPGRSYNVEAAAKAVDGTVLPPGGIFDYGKAIQKAKKLYGFREAPVIVNGKLQPGTGGGICQVSSTLYNTALHSGLEIVERRNHSLPVSYLPKGQDATFAEGSINFRFRNNTGKYLLIKSVVQNRMLTVKMFGTFPENVSYLIESETVRTLNPTEKVLYDSSLAPGTTMILDSGKTGYIVETYITRLVDGKPVEKKKLSRDVYRAQTRLIAVNHEGARKQALPEAEERPILEDGVRSE
jgi:vancomycin resistance protein YoaR